MSEERLGQKLIKAMEEMVIAEGKNKLFMPAESDNSFIAQEYRKRVEEIEDIKVISQVMREALQWSYEMLLARDQMNSKVHCAPVRLSPITERVGNAITEYDKTIKI